MWFGSVSSPSSYFAGFTKLQRTTRRNKYVQNVHSSLCSLIFRYFIKQVIISNIKTILYTTKMSDLLANGLSQA